MNPDDGNPCTTDSCDPMVGVQHAPVPPRTPCADADPCDGTEVCDASGVCQAGDPLDVDDGDPCTTDSCDPVSGPTHKQVDPGTSCSHNDDVCDGDETCDANGACVMTTPPPQIDDGNDCTLDLCDPLKGAHHGPTAAKSPCTDNNVCTQSDACDGAGHCQSGKPVNVDDHDACTADSCDPATGPLHEIVPGASCSLNSNPCDGDETCDANGACVQTTPPPAVDDGNECTIDACTPGTGEITHEAASCGDAACVTGCDPLIGCLLRPTGTSCSDGDVCNGSETCDASGLCVSGAPAPVTVACGVGDGCSSAHCDGIGSCDVTSFVSGTACDDGNPCTINDACDGSGTCVGAADANGACDDGDLCNGAETCSNGACFAGTPVVVDDNDPTTLDACDPSSGTVLHSDCAAQLDLTVSTTLAAVAKCLYVGAAPLESVPGQPFAANLDPLSAASPFPPNEISVLRGKVSDRLGNGLQGVLIEVENQPQLGQTVSTWSREDGRFDLAVRGGGFVTVKYTKTGYLASDRQVAAEWQHFAAVPDVSLIPLDPMATTIALDPLSNDVQVARGSVVADDDGIRQATVMFMPGTTASWVDSEGLSVGQDPPDTLTVRATEFTIGAGGPSAMPAELPALSAYTYALELCVDEPPPAGATSIKFHTPVAFYVDNFLGFPVGGIVPVGSYDRAAHVWKPEPNGRVIKILSVTLGLADVDTDDVPGPDNGLSLSDDERRQLAATYAPGQTLWRVEMTHFTPWDCNWPYGPPPDACKPGDAQCSLGGGSGAGAGGSGSSGAGGSGGSSSASGAGAGGPDGPEPDDDPCEDSGSIIECENQTLGERVPIVGAPYSLNYRSDRVAGRADSRTLTIPLTGAYVPPSLKQIELTISVAGQHMAESFPCSDGSAPCAPAHVIQRTWDGKDAQGRDVQGRQQGVVSIGYTYDGSYMKPAPESASFGGFGVEAIAGNRARQEVTLWSSWNVALGSWRLCPRGSAAGTSMYITPMIPWVACCTLATAAGAPRGTQSRRFRRSAGCRTAAPDCLPVQTACWKGTHEKSGAERRRAWRSPLMGA